MTVVVVGRVATTVKGVCDYVGTKSSTHTFCNLFWPQKCLAILSLQVNIPKEAFALKE